MTHFFQRDSPQPYRAYSLCGKHLRTDRFVHPDGVTSCLECREIHAARHADQTTPPPPPRKEAA